MRKGFGIVLILAVVLLYCGCASSGETKKTEGAAPGQEEYAPPTAASDEPANGGEAGIPRVLKKTAAQVKKAMKKAVDETVEAVNISAKDLGHKAGHFGKSAGAVVAGDLASGMKAVVSAAKDANAKGRFPWWIIILIIILIILTVYFRSGKTGKPKA